MSVSPAGTLHTLCIPCYSTLLVASPESSWFCFSYSTLCPEKAKTDRFCMQPCGRASEKRDLGRVIYEGPDFY